jgi:integrase
LLNEQTTEGESLAYVKGQMGHASIQITVDIYGHLVPGGNRSAVDLLDTWRATLRNASNAQPPPTIPWWRLALRLSLS